MLTLALGWPRQVLVKNEYTGINFIDTYFRKGGPAYTQALPFVSGQEGGGVIVDVTPKAVEAGLAVGQRVAYSVQSQPSTRIL